MSKETVLTWKKPERPFPKRSPSMTSILQSLNQEKSTDKKPNFFNKLCQSSEQNSSLNESRSKLTIKDLCPEDKTRIANLIKELAKISDEKKQIERSLEEERRCKEAEIAEVLKQQENLLSEKEVLLKKFSKIQQKLVDIQKDKKEKLPPRPVSKNKPDDKQSKSFNPFKSSTPKNLSPRSLSPISNVEKNSELKEVKNEGSPRQNESGSSDDARKYELIREQMELAEEQKKLKDLLESQEEILREKQAQIMIQQQLHLKRLEELTMLKSESQRQLNSQAGLIYQPVNQTFPHFQVPFAIPNYGPVGEKPMTAPIHPEQASTPAQSDSGIKLNDLDEESLDNLANIVYKKMMLKKKTPKPKVENEPKINKNQRKSDQDESLVDLIIEETKSVNNLKKKNTDVLNNEDLEESKLIEDLFFIK
ncbi:hinderin isoform X2 [Brachionus plicatilis]|uniref:Hinderin isoform X2 n=1 Tax=Brachionus plicatilis TaxID=10195 RepID=A0A3M7S0Y2_BRAPC|nr:hinderin isoform X2 [Brachionus plicatilis]